MSLKGGEYNAQSGYTTSGHSRRVSEVECLRVLLKIYSWLKVGKYNACRVTLPLDTDDPPIIWKRVLYPRSIWPFGIPWWLKVLLTTNK